MSLQDSAGPAPASEPIIEQKQRNNIYTMMLILAFIGICVACVMLWLELQEYGSFPWWKTSNIPVPATSSVDSAAQPLWLAAPAVTCWWA